MRSIQIKDEKGWPDQSQNVLKVGCRRGAADLLSLVTSDGI